MCWVGLDGFSNSTVEQDGTLAFCQGGTATYYTWWEMYPTNDIQLVGSSVAPGDKIVTSVKFAGGNYTLKVTDSTHPANSFTAGRAVRHRPVTCANASAEWIAETVGTLRGYAAVAEFRARGSSPRAKVTGGGDDRARSRASPTTRSR